MKKDKLRLYIIESVLFIVLCLAFFVSNKFDRISLAIFLALIAFITGKLVRKKKAFSFNSKQVTLLMLGFALIYLLVFYLMGIYFKYYKAPTVFGFKTILNYIIPFTVIIFASESIRKSLIIYKEKPSRILMTSSMILVDLVIYASVYDIFKLEDMLSLVGFVLFASIACNLLYNYITFRFGSKGVIIYRLITILYVYFIPYIPDIYIFFRSFLRMLYPYIIYLTLEYTYSKSNYATAYKDKKKNIISTFVIVVIMSLLIALISCRFRFGILVIGSGSMKGSIDKGDAIIFEKYNGDLLNKDEVIVFNKGDIKVVHRIIKIENLNDEIRYYTKGDANATVDDGYRTKDDVLGTTVFKIKYIGYPTLWLRDIFKG